MKCSERKYFCSFQANHIYSRSLSFLWRRILIIRYTCINEIEIHEVCVWWGNLNLNMQLEVRVMQGFIYWCNAIQCNKLKSAPHKAVMLDGIFILFKQLFSFQKNLGGPFWFTLACWHVKHESMRSGENIAPNRWNYLFFNRYELVTCSHAKTCSCLTYF